MIATLSRTFTGIFGPWGYFVFLTGALVTLYSTLFASVAANAIMGLDCLTVFGFLSRNRPLQRIRWRRGLQVFWAAVYATIFLAFPEQPVQLIVVGGVVQTGMLPVIACSILYLRYRRLDRGIGPLPLGRLAAVAVRRTHALRGRLYAAGAPGWVRKRRGW